MIYAAQLHAGDWYVLTRTNAPDAASLAIDALPNAIFEWNQEAEARAAAEQAIKWVKANRWRIVATDRATGKEITLSEGEGCPRQRIKSHLTGEGKYYGLRAIPMEGGAE
jgi:hypothetical protein